ncbi:MAG: ectonucleotide pyrophosphatase/phosphodiesterase [Bacillota bacterium]
MKKIFFCLTLIFAVFSDFHLLVAQQNKPYLILVSFDAFRWDYPQRGITPNLDFIKNNGVSALSLRPAFPSKTFPNHQSIITGMYPAHHGIIHNDFTDPFTKEKYKISDSLAVSDPKWYLGEAFWETCERQGIKTASYFWPGSELNLPYRRPTYFQHYEHKRNYYTIINGVVDWLKLPYKDRPHFITTYIHETDDMGHKFGPNSPQANQAIQLEDSLIGYLFNKLKDADMLDSTNIIILSDHGMTEVSKEKLINIEEIIGPDNKMDGEGPVMMIEPNGGDVQQVYNILKANENHFKVFTRNNIPDYYEFSDHPFIYSIIVVADPGWTLVDNKSKISVMKYTRGGNHGYDKDFIDMHGIFFAYGPAFKQAYRTGTLWNIDVYPLLCKIFGIVPRSNIDGKFERIGFILK